MKQKEEKKRIPIRQIEEVLENAPGIFQLSDIAAKLNSSGDDELMTRLEKLIDGDDNYFHSSDWECELKMHFFCRTPFAVTPDKWEINEGVLFPANRLTPFLSEDLFPSDAELLYDGEAVPKKEITMPFGEALRYLNLIGHEQVLDYLEADSDANDNLSEHLSPTTLVTMTVFDCRELFEELSFKAGDSFILQLTDPDTGEFEINFRPAEERSEDARDKWIADYEKAMIKVIDNFRDYLEIAHQIHWAFYYGGEELASAAASVEEFVRDCDSIEMRTKGDHSLFIPAGSQGEYTSDEDNPLPDGFSISSGETSDFGAMLKEVGSPLTPDEIDGFILDNCAARDLNFDRFFARAFPHGQFTYADEAQEAVFMNFLEERFEELTEHYNRLLDEAKAPLRSTIMELVEEKLEHHNSQEHDHGHDHGHCSCHDMEALFVKIDALLRQLNNEAFDPSAEEVEEMQSVIEQFADRLDELME